jgi:hypothetical protein
MKLKVRAVSDICVPDYLAQEAGVVRYVGRRVVAMPAAKGRDQLSSAPTPMFESVGDVLIDNLPEYRQAVRDLDLEPADEATARLCGVPFPRF